VKILYFGSSQFSLPFIDALHNSSHTISGVVTGIKKIRSRGSVLLPDPLYEYSSLKSLNVFEIEAFDGTFYTWLKTIDFDYLVSVSFGKIIPSKLIEIAGGKTINLHPSLLPKYRGPSPIISTLLNGDPVGGISLIKIEKDVDSGDIYMQTKFSIGDRDNKETLENKIIKTGSRMMLSLLDIAENDYLSTFPQGKRGVSYTRLFTREDMHIDWKNTANSIFNKIRGFGPSPGCHTSFNNKLIKITRACKVTLSGNIYEKYLPGQVISANREGLIVKCSNCFNSDPEEFLAIEELKPQNKNVMSFKEFINGYIVKQNSFFV
jgi:methionyl-tRNA formyltransferase